MNKEVVIASSEYFAHLKRDKKPYSVGHQVMYQFPIALMRGKKFNILDVGFGIGWGLDRMVEAKVVERYVGYEPNLESFNYVMKKYRGTKSLSFRFSSFSGIKEKFQHVFCIEVIEHVHRSLHGDFVKALRDACEGTLWLSTPDASRESHGVVTRAEMVETLRHHFENVMVHEEQWTTMYVAQ